MKNARAFSIVLLLMFALLSAPADAQTTDSKGFQFKKQPELQQIKPKKPVKIKLRRTAKEDYTWELTGDDADEIIRTDKKLRHLLGQK